VAKEKPKDRTIDYFRDNALSNKTDDEFEHKHYVSVLKDILLKSQTPINVGLYGKWGVGKSSIVHMLKEEIENGEDLEGFEYVEVDAWGISGRSLQQGILEEINANLGFPYSQEELEDTLYNIQHVDTVQFRNLFRSYWWIWAMIMGPSIPLLFHAKDDIVSALSMIGFASIVGALVPLSRLFFSTSKRIIPRAVSTFQFNSIYEKIIENRNKKLVVVIDNLDRCEDTVAVELLGIIQTFMVKENCINILACDDEAIVTHLKNVKKNYTDKDGNEFLSKFFQITIRIPPFIGENLSSYAEKLIKKRSVKFNPFVKPILISGAIENPRKINQFLNIAVALYRLAELKENAGRLQKGSITGNTNFLMKMIVIRHEWPEFYRALEILPGLIGDDKDRQKWYTEQIKGKTISKEEADRLARFLNSTRSSYAADITPFLRLNQESYAAASNIGEFEDAVITLNPRAVEIFQDQDEQRQEQFLNKIKDIMKKSASDPEKLTLVNCALSLIDILPKISNSESRVTALATLGEHMSLDLLDHLDRFNVDELGLFEILEEMVDLFSKPIYEKFISKTFENERVDDGLLELFFKNGGIVKNQIINEIDKSLGDRILANSYANTELLARVVKDYNWVENNIAKPSHTVTSIIEHIGFDETPESITNSELYEKIKDFISTEEKAKYFERVKLKINECKNANAAFPPRLLEFLKNSLAESFEENSAHKQEVFASLCDAIESNPDIPQTEETLKTAITLSQKISNLPNQTVSPEQRIGEAIRGYIRRSDASMMKNMLDDSACVEFLTDGQTLAVLISRYEELGSNIPEVIRFLLATRSYSAENLIVSKCEEMITSGDETKFQTLLSTAKENSEEFNPELVRKIGELCLKEAEDEENTARYSMYEHATEIGVGSYGRTKISDYAIKLISDESPATQDQGFSLLRKYNTKYADSTEPAGVSDAIHIATKLIETNSQRAAQYLGFIFEFKERFAFSLTSKVTELFRRSLASDTSEVIADSIVQHIKQSSEGIIKDVVDELIDFAGKTSYANAKEQCRMIFIENKDQIRDRHVEDIEKIYGAGTLD